MATDMQVTMVTIAPIVSPRFPWRISAATFALLLLTALVYLPGLTSPLLLDDDNNLAPLVDYLHGERSAANVIFGNGSGELGRPLSMASFVVNAKLTGDSVYALKATNLALHLLTGLIAILLLQRLLARDPLTARNARWAGLLLGGIWLLHPMQVSTVLYAVQRMAMLAALFSFAALCVYVVGRERAELRQRGAAALLFGVFPLFVLLGVASKENAVLILPLTGVLECILLTPTRSANKGGHSRPRLLKIWLALFIALPALLVAAVFLSRHFGPLNYSERDFSLIQRLLSEARVLWDYIGTWLLPNGDRLGVFHDDYKISTALLTPATTLIALLGWGVTIIAALHLRREAPAFSAGVLFFLCGHSLESSFLPLELYFEHRNYLPSLGILLALTGAIAWLAKQLTTSVAFSPRLGIWVLVVLLPAYAFATWVQSSIWGQPMVFWAQQEAAHPNSVRVRTELSNRAIETGNLNEALRQLDLMEPNVSPGDAMMPLLRRLLAYCHANQAVPNDVFQRLGEAAHGAISNYALQVWSPVVNKIEASQCPALDANQLANIGQAWLRQAPNAASRNGWLARFSLSLLLASQSRFTEAEVEGQRAWKDSRHSTRFGIFLYQLEGTMQNASAQKEILTELEHQTGKGDGYIDHAVAEFRKGH